MRNVFEANDVVEVQAGSTQYVVPEGREASLGAITVEPFPLDTPAKCVLRLCKNGHPLFESDLRVLMHEHERANGPKQNKIPILLCAGEAITIELLNARQARVFLYWTVLEAKA